MTNFSAFEVRYLRGLTDDERRELEANMIEIDQTPDAEVTGPKYQALTDRFLALLKTNRERKTAKVA